MKILIRGTNLDLTDALKSYVEEKIGNLDKFFVGEILEARVELEKSTHHQTGFFRCEVNLDVPQRAVLRAETTLPDLYAAIDETVPKLHEQIEKLKTQQRQKDRKFRRYLKSAFAWVTWKRRKNI